MLYQLGNDEPNIHETSYIAPSAQIIGKVNVKDQATVWFQAVLRGDNDSITLGKGSNIQDGVIVHTDENFPVIIGEHVTVGHNAVLHGCTIEDGALIGMGATILNGAVIKKGALVAAGALVTENKVVPEGTLFAGQPARFMKDLNDKAQENIKEGASHYVEKGNYYRQHLSENIKYKLQTPVE